MLFASYSAPAIELRLDRVPFIVVIYFGFVGKHWVLVPPPESLLLAPAVLPEYTNCEPLGQKLCPHLT